MFVGVLVCMLCVCAFAYVFVCVCVCAFKRGRVRLAHPVEEEELLLSVPATQLPGVLSFPAMYLQSPCVCACARVSARARECVQVRCANSLEISTQLARVRRCVIPAPRTFS